MIAELVNHGLATLTAEKGSGRWKADRGSQGADHGGRAEGACGQRLNRRWRKLSLTFRLVGVGFLLSPEQDFIRKTASAAELIRQPRRRHEAPTVIERWNAALASGMRARR